MFRGNHPTRVDEKGRLKLPADFKRLVDEKYANAFYITSVDGDRALIYPMEEWQRIEEKLNAQPMFTPEVRQLSRLYMSRAMEASLDGAGRILLPPDTRKQAGLEKNVTLIGGGRRMFEVWDRPRFEEYERTQGDSLPTRFEKLSAYGV